MAWLEADAAFDPDQFDTAVIGIAAKLSAHDSGHHQHQKGQLLYAQRGCIKITFADQLCFLPAGCIAWIPPCTLHRAEMQKVTGYRSIYFDTQRITDLPRQVTVFAATTLLIEVLERIAYSDFSSLWSADAYYHLLQVCLNELATTQRKSVMLKFPQDRRLSMLGEDAYLMTLKQLALQVGASEKTIARIFLRETGLSFQQWRKQWRYLRALELLPLYNKVSPVAEALHFCSDSAFIHFFKSIASITPAAYLQGTSAQPIMPAYLEKYAHLTAIT